MELMISLYAVYKGYMIKEYFMNYSKINSDVEVNLKNGKIKILKKQSEKWKIKLIDTGLKTMTGGRIKVRKRNKTKRNFLLNLRRWFGRYKYKNLIQFHKNKKVSNDICCLPRW